MRKRVWRAKWCLCFNCCVRRALYDLNIILNSPNAGWLSSKPLNSYHNKLPGFIINTTLGVHRTCCQKNSKLAKNWLRSAQTSLHSASLGYKVRCSRLSTYAQNFIHHMKYGRSNNYMFRNNNIKERILLLLIRQVVVETGSGSG